MVRDDFITVSIWVFIGSGQEEKTVTDKVLGIIGVETVVIGDIAFLFNDYMVYLALLQKIMFYVLGTILLLRI